MDYFSSIRLLLYRSLFMSELLVATGLFSFTLPRRKGFYWRLPLALLLSYGSCFIFPTDSSAIFSTASFLVMFLVVFASCFLVFDSEWKTLLFCTVAAYNTQHSAYELYDFFLRVFRVGAAGSFYETTSNVSLFNSPLQAIMYLIAYLSTYWLFYLFFARRLKKGSPVTIHRFIVFALVIVCGLADNVINSVIIEFVQEANNSTLIVLAFLSLLLCIVCMTMQFEIATRSKLDSDIATLKVVRSKEREQYQISKQNAELLSIKAHDLKHQIHELGQRKSISDETIEEISSLVDIYDSDIKTGNPSMDMVLTEKSRLCNKRGIHLSLMADGKALSQLSESDVYSLLGNIIDNAIEATIQLPENQRSISLNIHRIKGFSSIVSDNPYLSENLKFGHDGLPITSKANKANHGYGIKSIAYVARKYEGDLTIKAEDGIFHLSILLPDKVSS
ncbi:MAG: sensor histidine kinase [Bacilli bacterium]|nr:sensor histidine kinase [Bacilli bacterium]